MRVHELAKELGVASKELLAALEQMGVTGRSASSSVPEDLVPRLRASGGKPTTVAAVKRREVLEPPPSPKPRRAAKPKETPKAAAAEEPKEAPAAPAAAPVPAPSKPKPARPAPELPQPTLPVLQVLKGATPQQIAEKLDRALSRP